MEEAIRMVDISKMKHTGCCFNCLYAHGEADIYRIEIEEERVFELCKDCLSEFVKEISKEYSEKVGN